MTSSLVLATDLSPFSARTLESVASLASGLDAEVVLLHVVRGPPAAGCLEAPPLADPSLGAEVARAEQRLQELRAQWPPGSVVSVAVTVDEQIDAGIAEFARQRQAAYLVLSTHGRTGVRRLVMGSVAEGVLRRARMPVVVVPR